MKPTTVRYKYVVAKAKMLTRNLNLSPPVQVNRVIESQKLRLEYILDLHEPIIIKYEDEFIILLPPLDSEEQARWVTIEKFAHICLRHFEIYPVQRMIFSCTIETLSDPELEILNQEARVFALELLMPEELVQELIKDTNESNRINTLKNYFGVTSDIVAERLSGMGLLF